MSKYEMQSEIVEYLVNNYGMSYKLAAKLVITFLHLIDKNDKVEFAAEKIYNSGGYELIEIERTAMVQNTITNAEVILKEAMNMLQRNHSEESIQNQNRLRDVFDELWKVKREIGKSFMNKGI